MHAADFRTVEAVRLRPYSSRFYFLLDADAALRQRLTEFAAKHFMVPVKEIEEKVFDLSINRYKEPKHEEVQYDPRR